MKKIFMREFNAYLADHPEDEAVENYPIRIDKKFSDAVQPGEIRLFADVCPPRSGLFYKCLSNGEWLVIPLSEPSFTVPASNQEALIGDNVYQFWNEIRLPDFLARRSYFEGRLTDEEIIAVRAVLLHLHIGVPMPKGLPVAFGEPVIKKNDKRLSYFRRFQLTQADFDLNLIWRVQPISKKITDGLPLALAAADGSDSPVFIIYREGEPDRRGTFSEDYRTCRLAIPFASFGAGLKPKVLKFKEVGALPEDWNVTEGAFVSIHERTTRKQIGSGRIDLTKNEIVINDFTGSEKLATPVKSTADIVLVIVNPKGN